MAALSANSDREAKGAGRIISYPVAKEVEEFYKGAIIICDSTGYALAGSDLSGGKFLGIAVESLSITTEDAADGTHSIRCYTVGDFRFDHETGDLTIANVGDLQCVYTDNDTDDATKCSTGAVECGEIVAFEGVADIWLRIDNYSGGRMRVAAA